MSEVSLSKWAFKGHFAAIYRPLASELPAATENLEEYVIRRDSNINLNTVSATAVVEILHRI